MKAVTTQAQNLFRWRNFLIFSLILFFSQVRAILPESLSEKKEAENKQLTVKIIQPWPALERFSTTKAGEAGPAGFLLEVRWPMEWDKGTFAFLVNGKRVPFRQGGGGYGSGFYEDSYYVYAGEPGKKIVEVIFTSEKMKARCQAQAEFSSTGGLVVLDLVEGELSDRPQPLKFLSWLFNHQRVLVNGLEQSLTREEISSGLQLLTCQPEFKPGLNQITFSGVDYQGNLKEFSLNLFYAEDRKVKIGDIFSLKFDCHDTKSYSHYLVVEGQALVRLEKKEPDNKYLIFKLDKDNFFAYEFVCQEFLKAVSPGQATVKLVRSWWRGGDEVLKEINFLVQER
jgi:hypothetical protein